MKVFVYFNLHKKVWSVKALEGPSKGLVIQHATQLKLKDVIFKVSEAGRQRVIAEKRKNVHAGVVGTLVDYIQLGSDVKLVSYNPYKAGHFYDKATDQPIYNSSTVYMNGRSVWAS